MAVAPQNHHKEHRNQNHHQAPQLVPPPPPHTHTLPPHPDLQGQLSALHKRVDASGLVLHCLFTFQKVDVYEAGAPEVGGMDWRSEVGGLPLPTFFLVC